MISRGTKVAALEISTAGYVGSIGGIAVASGTAALTLALKTLGIGVEDEIIVPTYVCRSVSEAVMAVGAKPVFCDIGPDWNMIAETVETRLTLKTRAIIVVHIFGLPAQVKALKCFGVPLIEDCCQALGAVLDDQPVGGIGEIGVFSFHATKCITTGEGGLVTANSHHLWDVLRATWESNAIPSPMTDLQAALGLSQLNRYASVLARRLQLAQRYFDGLPKYLTAHLRANQPQSIFFRFPLESRVDFDKAQKDFARLGVIVKRGVDELLHRRFNLADEAFPNAVKLFNSTLSIPIYPALTDDEQQQVIRAVQTVLG